MVKRALATSLCGGIATLLFCGAATVVFSGCTPDFGQPPSLVTGPRLLAIKGEPAEVRPGDSVMVSALSVSPSGTDPAPQIAWALCLTPKPLDENNVVAGACLGGGDGVMALGAPGPTVSATVPLNACALFGPDPPPQMPGQPPLRPRDPDVSGGYYQPLRAELDAITGFGLERISCELAQAGAAIAVEFAMQYQANTNPMLLPLTAADALSGQPVALNSVKAGSQVDFTASWPAASAESYPVYDIVAQALVTHRESLRVSWFATDGSFEHDTTGRDETETETTTDDVWTAPAQAEPVHLWMVLRDSRGGIDFAAYDLAVTP
jgi:hypothetical protein